MMKSLTRPYIAVLFALLGVAIAINRSPQAMSDVISWLMPTQPGESGHFERAADSVIDGDSLTVIDGKKR
jgi:hypothetical protein